MAVSDNSNSKAPICIERSAESAWKQAVRIKCRSRCSNCGSTDKLRVRMIVPEEAGGKMIESNGVVLCRVCEMAAGSIPSGSRGYDRRLISFWVSRNLHSRILEAVSAKNGFRSMGSLIRYLMSQYISDEQRFDDLEQYQDSGSEVKLNVWVDRDRYEDFRSMLQNRGVTVTDGLKSLFRMYDLEAGAIMRRNDD